ncbi:MAG: T9SS type A sorting domain-containing protein, partial [Balneolaceae bacterium]|nr:T9SS type A sorting domain-containing protein [Balneolaceae bacterium]
YPLHKYGNGWNMLGNQYGNELSVRDISSWADDSLRSQVVQYWDSEVQSFVLSTSRNHAIPPWKGFFLQNQGATQIDIPNPDRARNPATESQNRDEASLLLNLKAEEPDGEEALEDRAIMLYFHENGRNQWDQMDAEKLRPLGSRYVLLGIRGSGQEELTLLSQDARPYDFEGELRYNLEMITREAGRNFTLEWDGSNLPDNWKVTLVDNENGRETDMHYRDSYFFRTDGSNDAESDPGESASERGGQFNGLPSGLVAQARPDNTPRFTIMVSKNSTTPSVQSNTGEIANLNPNYPNPFNNATTINYDLAQDANVVLSIWNIVGQKVETLIDGVQPSGEHEVVWNASSLPSGFYIARLEVDGKVFIRKMTLIK